MLLNLPVRCCLASPSAPATTVSIADSRGRHQRPAVVTGSDILTKGQGCSHTTPRHTDRPLVKGVPILDDRIELPELDGTQREPPLILPCPFGPQLARDGPQASDPRTVLTVRGQRVDRHRSGAVRQAEVLQVVDLRVEGNVRDLHPQGLGHYFTTSASNDATAITSPGCLTFSTTAY